GSSQQMYFKSNAGTGSLKSQNVIICGVEGDGGNVSGAGNTAFRIEVSRGADNNEDTYQFNNLMMFNCYAHDCYEETIYLGHTNDALSGGLGYPYFTNALYYRVKGENAGNEVM